MAAERTVRAQAGILPLVFFTGAAVLILEIMGTRVISPFFGSTVYVWSSLIAVTLASLAAGYAAGGALADRPRASASLCGCLALSGAWLLAVPLMRGPVLLAASSWGVQAGALASAAVLFAPPLFFLGAVGPLCVRLRTTELARVGREVGAVTSVSTVGSVVGALLAGFYLIPRIAVPSLLSGLGVVLLLAAGLCAWRLGGGRLAALAAVCGGAAALTGSTSPRPEGIMRDKAPSFYGDVKVVEYPRSSRRVLYIDGIPNTVADLATLDSVSDYITSFELLPFMRPKGRRALLIGLGGGSLVARFERHYGIETDVVEIDPVIERFARKWFAFKPSGRVAIADGRGFLARTAERYDFIVVDAFAGDQHPYHLFSREAFSLMLRRLGREGVLAVNVIGYARGPKARLMRSLGRTLREVYPHVKVFGANRTLDLESSYVNLTFLASAAPLEPRRDPEEGRPSFAAYWRAVRGNFIELKGGTLITDDHNPIEAMSAPAFLAIRRRLLRESRGVMAH